MSEEKSTRIFKCPHCGTGIQIPADLPPTKAPCPKCAQVITSPPPEEPVSKGGNATTSIPKEAPPKKETPVTEPAPEKVARPQAPQEDLPERVGGSPSKLKKLPFIVLGVIFVALIPAVFKILLPGRKATDADQKVAREGLTFAERQDNAYRSSGWIPEAEEVLQKFVAAESIEERAALTIRGKQNESEMAAIYQDFDEIEHRTPVSVFSPVSLGDQDTKRGIFLMTYSRPEQFAIRNFFRPIPPLRVKYGLEEPNGLLLTEASVNNFVDESVKVMAFFRKTPDGLKLDWQTYAQTKYRLLNRFIANPEPRKRGIFRVFVQEDVDLDGRDVAGTSVYRFTDPAYQLDYAKVLIRDESELGKVLAPLKWRTRVVRKAPVRNATVSLVWSDDPEPELQMGELICWEFLGLGGERDNWKAEVGE